MVGTKSSPKIEQSLPSAEQFWTDYNKHSTLSGNLLVASVQLFIWLIFRPSAWKNLVREINPNLSPDFCLLQLEPADWRSPLLRRLLIAGYLVWPAMFGLPVILGAWLLGMQSVVIGATVCTVIYLVASIFIGVHLNLGGAFITFTVGFGFTILGSSFAAAEWGLQGQTHFSSELPGAAIWGVVHSFLGGVVCGFISHLSTKRPVSSRIEQALSVFAGTAVGMVMYSVALVSTLIDDTQTVYNLLISGVPTYANNGLEMLATLDFFLAGFTGGLAAGVLRTGKWGKSLSYALIGGLTGAITIYLGQTTQAQVELSHILLASIAAGIWMGAVFSLPYTVAQYISGPQAAAFAGACGLGISHTIFIFTITGHFHWLVIPFSLFFIFLGLACVHWLPTITSPLLEIYNLILYRFDERRDPQQQSYLWRHSAFWNELRRNPSLTLKNHLLLVIQRSPAEAQAAIDFLVMTCHRPVAQAAQVELDAHRLEGCGDVEAIGQAHHFLLDSKLKSPAGVILHEFYRVSQAIEAALAQTTGFHQRRALVGIAEELDGLRLEFTRSDEPDAPRFIPIIVAWRQTVADHIRHLNKLVELRQEIDNPYVYGLPLTEQQKIFTGRVDVALKIEQLLLDPRRPPLLLYGQRRMGKTSLLQNLGRMFRSKLNIVPIFIDGQEIKLAGNYGEFLHLLASEIQRAVEDRLELELPELDPQAFQKSPFAYFIRWLNASEKLFRANGNIVGLLMLDEFEAVEQAIDKGRFDTEDVFSLLRHIIQHRPRLKVLLAGSQTLPEFEQWASYLINVQVIKLDYLEPAEACQLIEQPVEQFTLGYKTPAAQRIFDLTRGHPGLVQLLCYELVELKNTQPTHRRRLVDVADVETAAQIALKSGHFFFAEIKRDQLTRTGREVMAALAKRGEGAIVSLEQLSEQVSHPARFERTMALLLQRDLVERVNGGYRFQVELIRRWFAQEGEIEYAR